MNHHNLNLLDALQIAMQAEQKAAALYADAAQETSNPLGQRLFEQLADFERHHYNKLSSLAESLRDGGAFIEYEGKDMQYPVPGEVKSIEAAGKMSAMAVITMAIDVEREAEQRYTTLAQQTTDPAGQSMFQRLAEEEHTHYLILSDAYWNLNNRGTWEGAN